MLLRLFQYKINLRFLRFDVTIVVLAISQCVLHNHLSVLILLSWRGLVLLLFLIFFFDLLGLHVLLLLLLNLNHLSLILPLLYLFFYFFDNLLISIDFVVIRSSFLNRHSLLCRLMVIDSDVCIHHFLQYVHFFTLESNKVLHTIDSLRTALFTLCLRTIDLQ